MQKGIIPITLGLGVTATGIYIKKKMMRNKMMVDLATMTASGLVGFGAAHVLLGGLDLCIKYKKRK